MGCSDLACSRVYFPSGLESREKSFSGRCMEHGQKVLACLTNAFLFSFAFIIKNK